MDRRTFVKRLPVLSAGTRTVTLLTGVLGSSLTAACSGFHYVSGLEDQGRLVIPRSSFATETYALVETSQFPLPLYVHHHGDEDYSAVLAECTHRGCQPDPAGDRLVCPCHGSEFSLVGTVLEGPADQPLPRFDVTVSDDNVVIWLSRRSG